MTDDLVDNLYSQQNTGVDNVVKGGKPCPTSAPRGGVFVENSNRQQRKGRLDSVGLAASGSSRCGRKELDLRNQRPERISLCVIVRADGQVRVPGPTQDSGRLTDLPDWGLKIDILRWQSHCSNHGSDQDYTEFSPIPFYVPIRFRIRVTFHSPIISQVRDSMTYSPTLAGQRIKGKPGRHKLYEIVEL